MTRTTTLAAMAATLLTSTAHAGDVTWLPSHEKALEQAAAEKHVVFLAVNMDGERANDRMVEKVYRDKRITKLAERTLNLIASNDEHSSEGKTCRRFDHVTCKEHRFVDMWARGDVLKPDAAGYVVAPQHVFLSPDGAVILSVPYEVSAAELEWCFVTALKAVDADVDVEASSTARAPKRLILGDVYATGSETAKPMSREEALQLIKELKRGMQGQEYLRALRKLATADEPEAREFMITVLRTTPGGGGGGGRGGGGGGGRGGVDRRPELLRWIGVVSSPSWWEVCAEFVTSGEEEIRGEAVVALEQLAAPASLKVVKAALGKEKDETIKKNLFRALGAVAVDDGRARKTLLKQASDDRNDLWRRNAIVALGSLAADEDVDELLSTLLASDEGRARIAAVVAMGLTRDAKWVEPLEARAQEVGDEELLEAIRAAIQSLSAGDLDPLEAHLTKVAADDIPRERIFGE